MKTLAVPMLMLLFILGSLGAQPASAYFTPILSAPSEPDLLGPNQNNGQEGILDYLYGLDNLVRVDDSMDQIWQGFTPFGVTGKVMFYERSQFYNRLQFGYMTELNGRQLLFEADGEGYNVRGDGEFTVTDPFRFWLHPGASEYFSSREGDNPDFLDHMVTWDIVAGAAAGARVIAWESGNPGDSDFNDLVVEVRALDSPPVPEPASVALLGGGLLVAGSFAAARRRRRY